MQIEISEHSSVRHLYRQDINSVKIVSRGKQNGAPFFSESERNASTVTEHSVILQVTENLCIGVGRVHLYSSRKSNEGDVSHNYPHL